MGKSIESKEDLNADWNSIGHEIELELESARYKLYDLRTGHYID